MKQFVRLVCFLSVLAIAGCAPIQSGIVPTGDTAEPSNGPAIVLTAMNMNAHSSNVPVLNQKMGEEVSSVARFVQEKLQMSGRKVIRKDFENASAQDIARIIQEQQVKPTNLIQIYWSATDKGYVFLNITSLPIAYRAGGVKFGADLGKKFEILGPETHSTITAEEMAADFVRSTQH